MINVQSAGHEDEIKVTEIFSILINKCNLVALNTELRARVIPEVLKTL
jgi:hypothetical protein